MGRYDRNGERAEVGADGIVVALASEERRCDG